MAKVITVTNQKGGVGKSTITVNLAHSFKDNTPTAIVDLDPQGSITKSKERVSGVDVIAYKAKARISDLPYGAVFIDTPPYLSDQLLGIFEQSDLILIPVKAGVYDVLAFEETSQLVKLAMKRKPALKAAIVLNMVNSSTTLTEEASNTLASYELPILKTAIIERMSYIRSVAMPDGIYSTTDKKAIGEINSLTKEILFLLQ